MYIEIYMQIDTYMWKNRLKNIILGQTFYNKLFINMQTEIFVKHKLNVNN